MNISGVIYTLWNTFQFHHFTVQSSFSIVFKNAPTFLKKSIGYMFNTNYLSIEHRYKELATYFNKPKGKKKFIFPIFDNEFLSSLKNS